ncbi:MAG: hypothetical protein AAFU61_17575, partial [Pseudomonadota bacterium]
MTAKREGRMKAFSIALSVDRARSSAAFAGSISVNRTLDDTEAKLDGASISAAGDVAVRGETNSEILAIGGGAGVGGKNGVGGSIAFNQVAGTAGAVIEGAGATITAENVGVDALNDNKIEAIAVSAGVQATGSGGGTAFAGTLAINVVSVDPTIFPSGTAAEESAVEARITGAAVVAGGDVRVAAEDAS